MPRLRKGVLSLLFSLFGENCFAVIWHLVKQWPRLLGDVESPSIAFSRNDVLLKLPTNAQSYGVFMSQSRLLVNVSREIKHPNGKPCLETYTSYNL